MVIALIQALYDSKNELPSEIEYYRQAIEDIESFSISSQIYNLLKEQGNLNKTPSFFQERLKIKYKEVLYNNLYIKSETKKIFQQFEEVEIPIIPLKGVIFTEKYFGHIGARGTSDIDILIKKTNLKEAVDCLKKLGYSADEHYIPYHFHFRYNKKIPNSPYPLTVEIHWDLLKEGTSNLKIEEFWNGATPLDPYQYVKELSHHHTFYMICLHGWKHQMNSLRYFLDIIQLIYFLKDKLDYSALFEDAASHNTLKRTIRTLSITYGLFPQLDSVKRMPKKIISWWEYESLRTSNHNKLKQYMNLVSFQFLDYDKIHHQMIALFRWLFPSRLELPFELGSNYRNGFFLCGYFMLFKKRTKSILKTVLLRKG